MNINATLIIQAINFFIFYIVLRRFLLKPAIAIISHEEQEQESVKNIIVQQEQSLMLKEKERQKYWHDCRVHFKKSRPSIDMPQWFIFKGLTPDVEQYHVESRVIDKLASETYHSLEQKIGRVL